MLRRMTGSVDPWRTLGLVPGSSLDEIRRAYGRLAKANHPDAAGEEALPRFLALQAAYEALAGPSRTRRPGSRPGPTASRETRRADPARAWASGPADGRRRPPPGTRPAGASGPEPSGRTAGPSGTSSSTRDARPAGGRARPGE